MTFIKISEVAGCSERTVRRTAKELWPTRVFSKAGADLTEMDAVKIMEVLPKRNIVSGKKSGQMSAEDIGAIVRETVSAMIPAIIAAVKGLPVEQAALPAPAMDSRDELRMVINKAARDSGDYSGTYHALYAQIYYRLHINVRERAANAKVQPIDILEAEGLIPEAVAIAREIFG
jgi:hypothetical protein